MQHVQMEDLGGKMPLFACQTKNKGANGQWEN